MKKRADFTVLKVDVDIKMSKKLLREFIKTREKILETLGYKLRKMTIKETNKGYHFYITVEGKLKPKRIAELQFLLGDDHKRAYFNFLRAKTNSFHFFNVLFEKKKILKGEENG